MDNERDRQSPGALPREFARNVSRRRFIAGTAGVAAASAIGLGAGQKARAASLWIVAAGASGALSTNWHNDGFTGALSALDIDAGANAPVAIYARISGTSTYGYFFNTGILDSCEAIANPGQKKILFNIGRTSSSATIFGKAIYMHVFPYNISPAQSGLANRQIATVGSGRNQVKFSDGSFCYTGPHLHQGANGTHMWDPAVSPASAGNTEYWYWWV